MNTRSLALACLACLAVSAQAQLMFGLAGAAGAPAAVAGISDFGMSRIHKLEGQAQGNFARARPMRPVYGNLTFQTGPDTAPDVTEWINQLLAGHPEEREVWVFNHGPRQTTSFKCTGTIPIRWASPECNANRSAAGAMDIQCAASNISAGQTKYPVRGKQKAWLCSNFRLQLGDLPCSRVNKIEAIVVKQRTADDLDHDLWPECTNSDLIFTIPTGDVGPFLEWFNEGKDGPEARSGMISYLDKDGSTLASISMTAHIWSISPDPSLNPGSGFTTIKCAVKLNVWASTNK